MTETATKNMLSVWDEFRDPPIQYKSIPKWVWNTSLENMTTSSVSEQLRSFRNQDGYRGLMIVLWNIYSYMSEQYFVRYGDALDSAAKLGLIMIIWDENGFPTGHAGGLLEKYYPEHTAKRLDMTANDVVGPFQYERSRPKGKLMGVVMMNNCTKEVLDITGAACSSDDPDYIKYSVPPGNWKIMVFTCVTAETLQQLGSNCKIVDYLSKDAVGKFVELTHQQYYDRFSQHFDSTVRYCFYDEPSFWKIQGGRIWTDEFNEKFEAKYGYSPIMYYPALWFDIGVDTEAARNVLLGFRAELFATAFVKTLADWCEEHEIELTGHMDQEEVVNPVSLHGDLMKVFKYQHIPGIDSIAVYGRSSKAYKVVSSAAYNYDKPIVMCEAYGAMGEEMPINVLFKEAMDQYAKGVNFVVPHGTWYDNTDNVTFPPELSYRSSKFGCIMWAYNEYVGRLSRLLQYGRHVADIGVLYPIATLQAGYRFGEGDPYKGGVIPTEADYLDVGEVLALHVRRDFTFVHPEVLDEKCSVEGSSIELNNCNNYEQYKIFIIPGSKTIYWSNLQKIKRFYDNGGKVIATTQLPYKSAEFGHDLDVRTTVEEMFGIDPCEFLATYCTDVSYHTNCNRKGGKAIFIPVDYKRFLQKALDDSFSVYDVQFEESLDVYGGCLSYIHKVKEGMDIYFFANSSDTLVSTYVRLRGRLEPELWNPHTGTKRIPEYLYIDEAGQQVTRMRLELPPVRSVFIIGKAEMSDTTG